MAAIFRVEVTCGEEVSEYFVGVKERDFLVRVFKDCDVKIEEINT